MIFDCKEYLLILVEFADLVVPIFVALLFYCTAIFVEFVFCWFIYIYILLFILLYLLNSFLVTLSHFK